MLQTYDYRFKLLVIGDSGVGKSSIIFRYCNNDFDHNFITTIGVDFKTKTLTVYNKTIKLQIWDTAGQERFRTITRAYYRGAQAILLVYDITDIPSFNNVKNWLSYIKDNSSSDVLVILVGNKSDLEHKRQITYIQGESLARNNSLPFYETSSLNSSNVNNLFDDIVHKLCDKYITTLEEPVITIVEELPVKQCCS